MNLDKNFEMSLSMLTGLWSSLLLYTFVYMYMYPTTTPPTPTCTHQVRLWPLRSSPKVDCKSCLWHLAEIFHPLEASLVSSYIGALSQLQFQQCDHLIKSFGPQSITWLWTASVPSPACATSCGRQESWTDRSLSHTPGTWRVFLWNECTYGRNRRKIYLELYTVLQYYSLPTHNRQYTPLCVVILSVHIENVVWSRLNASWL